MTHRRCCDDPANLYEVAHVDDGRGKQPRRVKNPRHATETMQVALVCIVCGSTLATADDRGELWADC